MNWAALLLTLAVGASGTLLSVSPSTKATGHLPRFLRVTLELDAIAVATAVPGGATTALQYQIVFTGLTTLRGGVHPDTMFSPFVRDLSPTALAVDPRAPVVGTDVWITAFEPAGPSTCSLITMYTSADGSTLNLIDNGAANAGCLIINRLWELTIPTVVLAPNAPYPEVLNNFRLAYTAAAGAVSVPASVPWVTISTELIASALHFHRIVPDTTLSNAQVNSLFVSFTPGEQLTGGMSIALLVRSIPGTSAFFPVLTGLGVAGTANPVVPIGVEGCTSTPTDIYCCSQTTVAQPGDNQDIYVFNLLPRGCVLPAGKHASFTLPRFFLGRNPNPAAAGGANPLSVVLNAMLLTAGDQDGTYEGRYGRGIIDRTANPNPPNAIDMDGKGLLVAPTNGATNYWTNWAIGATAVSGFTGAIDNPTTGVQPGLVTLSWLLTSPLTAPAGGNGQLPPRFLVSANPGVFRRNIGTPANPRTLQMQPTACNGATYWTNEYGAIFITPSPVANGCFASLLASTRVTFFIPKEALLPNPSPQTVRFDVRGIPSVTNAGAAGAAPGAHTYVANIDTATLKDQVGYTTTAECSTDAVPSLTFSSPSDIANMAFDDRCSLVSKLASLSPGGAAIKQCPLAATGSGIVTYAKLPEGTWTQSSWPWTNVAALGNWGQVVGANPPIAITNWGSMVSYPMFAVVVTYPVLTSSLTSLGVTDAVPIGWKLAFIIRNDRLTVSCAAASLSNPWQFTVTTSAPIVAVKHVGPGNNVRATNVLSTLESLAGASWAQRANDVGVTVPQSGLVFGYTTVTPSPVPDDGSDDALFGLLALIAVPVLLCCCLLALLWFLRPKAEACPCVPEYPVQEMYWVNAQPCAPAFSVAQCGPSTTPVYLVQ